MKIWKSFSGDHSSKLKIIGEFKEKIDLNNFNNQFENFVKLIDGKEGINIWDFFKEEILKENKNFGSLMTTNDADATGYFSFDDVQNIKNNKILIEADDFCIEFILKLIIANHGKVEVLSSHDYPEWEQIL